MQKLKNTSCAEIAVAALAMHEGAWARALALLDCNAVADRDIRIPLSLWRARCHLKLNEAPQAITLASAFIDASAPLDAASDEAAANATALAWAHLLIAQALKQAGNLSVALKWLATSVRIFPSHPCLRRMLADTLLSVHGDWAGAALLSRPLIHCPAELRDVKWFDINRQIYCGSRSPEALSDQIRGFSMENFGEYRKPTILQSDALAWQHISSTSKPRLGLVSPLFKASPIYFLCIGALRKLNREFDLVFVSRGFGHDWATEGFQSIAHEWHEAQGLSAGKLSKLLHQLNLSMLLDMSGWMDLGVLHALAEKPVARQFKWVGGQSTTTGLGSFDGYISDEHQTPASSAHLYAEPLALLPSGYVTYTAPPYFPEPQAPNLDAPRHRVGVFAHPKKLSPPFLAYLRLQVEGHLSSNGGPVLLQFIGQAYGELALQARILAALGISGDAVLGEVEVGFVTTKGHRSQMDALAEMDWVVDTFPYTGGVTVLEALELGVPVRTHAGVHCAARHGYSHARFAGLEPDQINLQTLGVFKPGPLIKNGRTLLPSSCARKDHSSLAKGLAALLQGQFQTLNGFSE